MLAFGMLFDERLEPLSHELLREAMQVHPVGSPRTRGGRTECGITDVGVIAVAIAGVERYHHGGFDVVDQRGDAISDLLASRPADRDGYRGRYTSERWSIRSTVTVLASSSISYTTR
jgi:hypothetical protein